MNPSNRARDPSPSEPWLRRPAWTRPDVIHTEEGIVLMERLAGQRR